MIDVTLADELEFSALPIETQEKFRRVVMLLMETDGELQDIVSEQIAPYKEEINELKECIEDMKIEHEKAIDDLKDAHANELSDLKEAHGNALAIISEDEKTKITIAHELGYSRGFDDGATVANLNRGPKRTARKRLTE